MSDLVTLKSGSRSIDVDPDGFDVIDIVLPQQVSAIPQLGETAAMELALAEPIGAPPLEELARGAKTAAVLVSGKDRVTRADLFMPPLIQTLTRAGIDRAGISVFMATGTHVAFRPQDRPLVLGPDFDPAIEVIGHDCTDRTNLVELGTTSRGNRVSVNRRAFECDVKVLTGRITHHYFAGFTAGRKSVLPGVAALETIQFNHRQVITGPADHPHDPEIGNGRLEKNPVHLDMVEGAAMFEPTFIVNTVVNTDHGVTKVVAGDMLEAHAVGCAAVADAFEVHADRQADLAIGSCGGSPYDCSFMQALKTLMNTGDSVADGGVFILLAECPEGIKPDFLRWDHGMPLTDFAHEVLSDYDLTGHNTFLLREILQRITIILVSDCPDEQVERLGLVPAATLDVALERAYALLGSRHPSTTLIPFGNVTVVRHE